MVIIITTKLSLENWPRGDNYHHENFKKLSSFQFGGDTDQTACSDQNGDNFGW